MAQAVEVKYAHGTLLKEGYNVFTLRQNVPAGSAARNLVGLLNEGSNVWKLWERKVEGTEHLRDPFYNIYAPTAEQVYGFNKMCKIPKVDILLQATSGEANMQDLVDFSDRSNWDSDTRRQILARAINEQARKLTADNIEDLQNNRRPEMLEKIQRLLDQERLILSDEYYTKTGPIPKLSDEKLDSLLTEAIVETEVDEKTA